MKGLLIRCKAILALATVTAFLLTSCAGNPEKAKVSYLEKGNAYMKKGAYSSAAIEFRNAVKIDPKYAEAYYQLAQADLKLSKWKDAYDALNTAIDIDPNRSDARLLRGQFYLSDAANPANAAHRADDYARAEEDANSVSKQDPQNAEAHNLLAFTYFGEKKYDLALQQFSTLASLEPAKAYPHIEMGFSQYNLKQLTDAEQSFTKAVELEPKNAQTYLTLAQFYGNQKRMPEAESALRRGAQNVPGESQIYLTWAKILSSESKNAEAEAILRQGAQNVPGNIPIYIDWAATLSSEGKNSDAEATLKVLRDQEPKSVDVASAIADFYLKLNMIDKALAEYQRGLSIDAKNLPFQQKMEDIYLSTGKTELAATMDAALMKQAPNDSTNEIEHGRLLLIQGKLQESVRTLQRAVTESANSEPAHYWLAEAYSRNGDTLQANTEFQNALRNSPKLPRDLVALVQLNFSQSNFSVAQIYAQELVQNDAANPAYHLLLGESMLQLDKTKDAEEQFLTAKQLAPNAPQVHADLAGLYQSENKFSDAEKEFQTALRVAPQDSSALEPYSGFLTSRGEQAKAVSIVQQFLAGNPKDAHAHLILSNLKLKAKDYNTALSEAQRAIQLDPNSIAPLIQLGQVLHEQRNDDGAIQAYDKALSLHPESAGIVSAIGSIYLNQNDLARAAAEFQKALEIDPNLTAAENDLAWVYAEQGQNLDIALGLAQKAIARKTDCIECTDTLAWVMYRKGDYSGAIPYLQDCVKKSPDSGQYRYHLGMALVAAGQKQQGKALLQAALQMKLDVADSQQAREALSRAN